MSRARAPDVVRRRAVATAIASAVAVITVWAALGVDFSMLELLANLDRSARLLGDAWPPAFGFLPRLARPFLETLQIAILGTAAGALVALPVALFAARPVAPHPVLGFAARNAMNLLRTLPDLFWAMLFASAVGFGPLAGALALTVFTVAIVAKLLSESAEAIDLGLLEAVRASGGGWWVTVRFAVLPQIVPQYASFALYAFELNVRASTVLGLVGAGGIGQTLRTQLDQFEYARVTVIVLSIFLAVLAIEQASTSVRRRLA